jgi:F-type H+-transporting ATPase subunit epsilon
MKKLFGLKILTPEREFFSREVEAVTVELPDGGATILAGHMPMVAPVVISELKIKLADGTWILCFASEGFIEVRSGEVMIFLQTCEYPEEIDARRAEEARLRAEEKLRQRQSIQQYQQSKISLARAMERLRVKGHGK